MIHYGGSCKSSRGRESSPGNSHLRHFVILAPFRAEAAAVRGCGRRCGVDVLLAIPCLYDFQYQRE